MVRNGYGAKYIWYEIAILWYEMVMVQNSYGTKWFLVMVRNCNFVVRNGKLWYEMTCFAEEVCCIIKMQLHHLR